MKKKKINYNLFIFKKEKKWASFVSHWVGSSHIQSAEKKGN
jgi:hypothetical protein